MTDTGGADNFDANEWGKEVAIRVIQLVSALPKTEAGMLIGGELIRCAPLIGAHMERARHAHPVVAMLEEFEKVLQALDQTRYWLQILIESGTSTSADSLELLNEVKQKGALLTSRVQSAWSQPWPS